MYGRTLPSGRRSAKKRTVAGVCALAVGVLGWLIPLPNAEQPAVAVPLSAPNDDQGASARAATSGQRVEVIGKRSETARTFANPDGTFTLEQSNVPVRLERDGQWVDLDPTLATSPDGRVRPRATALDMSFSGGGTDPLISMKSDGHEMKLSWPGALPSPIVADDNLVYPNVFPDVDLKISVSTSSYTEVLIVKTPEAARLPQLQQLDLTVDAPSLDVAKVAGGAVLAKDDVGKVIFTGPPPLMWDSRGTAQAPTDDDRTAAPLEGDKVVPIPLEVSQESLKISPAASLVNDAAVEYPLHIDPPFSSAQYGRAMINERYPTTASWQWAGPEGVGYQEFEPWSRKRLIYQMKIGGLGGTHITSAVFSAYETWAASCTKKEVQIWKTAAINTNVTWNSGSGANVWLKKLASVTDAVGRNECTPNGKWLEFNVLTAVAEQAAARSAYVYLGLRAANEADSLAWKRFKAAVVLTINYNWIPVVTGMRTTNPTTGCATDKTKPARINQASPMPRVKVIDPDQQPTQAVFEFWYDGLNRPSWTGNSATLVSSDTREYTPQPTLPVISDGRLAGWRVRARDGIDFSAQSPMCWFVVDTTKPGPPEIEVTSGDGPYLVGQQVNVHIKSTAVDQNYYRYSIDSDEPMDPILAVSPGTFTYTVAKPGPFVIRAWSYDRTGNQSAGYDQVAVKVDVGPSDGKWYMDEGAGTVLHDSSGKGRDVNLSPSATWTQGDRFNVDPPVLDHAISLPAAATATSTTPNVIDTSRSFSVSARVRLGAVAGRHVAVSEDRTGSGGFMLGALNLDVSDELEPRVTWGFSIPDPDGSGQITAATEPGGYAVGDWVYLTGVYDSTTRYLQLYVDETPATPVAVPGTAVAPDGTGPLRIGGALDGGVQTHSLNGEVDDVRIYPGPIESTVVNNDRLDSNPTTPEER